MRSFRHRGVAACLAVMTITGAWAATEDETAVEGVLDAWAASFNGCDAARLAALYDEGASLWGTQATTLIGDPAGVRRYFDGACAMTPPVRVAIGEHATRVRGDVATIAGVYRFARDGAPPLAARFSFALQRREGRWAIVQHHSSLMPARP